MSTSDLALLERWVAHRDAEAFAELVRRHASMVYATCRRVLGPNPGAEDVAQECFAEAAQLANVSRINSLGGWLHTVATRRALNRIRAEERRRRREQRYAEESRSHAKVEPDDVQAYLDEAIAALPEKLRLPLVAHFLEGQTHQEVATALGIPRTTVTSHIAKGIERVRRHLKRRGIAIGASALVSVMTVESAQAAPPALIAALGKIALLGNAAPIAHALSHTSTLTTIGGAIMSMKQIVIIVAVIAAVACGYAGSKIYISERSAEQEPLSENAGVRVPDKTAAATMKKISRDTEAPGSEVDSGTMEAETALGSTDNVSDDSEVGADAIGGIVEDAEGSPVAGAQVKPWQAPLQPLRAARTDENGRFVLTGLEQGTYALAAFKSGKGFGDVQDIATGTGNVRITLTDISATISGRLYDADTGKGIEGVHVMPMGGQQKAISGALNMLAACQGQATNADGIFTIKVPAPASYRLVPTETQKAGYEQPIRQEECPLATVTPGETVTGIDMALIGGGSISGSVYDADGKPLAKAQLLLTDKYRGSNSPIDNTTSESDGSYIFRGAHRRWTYTVRAAYPGLAPVESESIVLEGTQDVTGVDLYLGKGQAIFGKVLTTAGEGCSDVDVSLMSGIEGDFVAIPGLTAKTDSEGAFTISNVAPGSYRAEVRTSVNAGGGTTVGGPTFTMPDGSDLTDLEITIGPRADGFISGRVTDASGVPLPNANVGAHSASAHGWARTDETGFYRIDGLGAADLWMMELGAGNGYEHEMRADVPVNSDHIDFVRKRGATVTGTVIDGSTGRPLRKFEVGNPPTWREFVSDTGTFSFDQIGGSTVTLQARSEGYTTASSDPIDIASGKTINGVTITLWPGESVVGTVIDAQTGEPIQGARITAFDGATTAEMLTRGLLFSKDDPVTDIRGRYEYTRVEAGAPANLIAWHSGYAPTAVMDSLEGEVNFALIRGGMITGTVSDGVDPAANVYISACKPGEFGYEASTHSDLAGAFTLPNLPPGTYLVQCRRGLAIDADITWRSKVSVENEQTIHVTPQFAGAE